MSAGSLWRRDCVTRCSRGDIMADVIVKIPTSSLTSLKFGGEQERFPGDHPNHHMQHSTLIEAALSHVMYICMTIVQSTILDGTQV